MAVSDNGYRITCPSDGGPPGMGISPAPVGVALVLVIDS